MQLFDMVNDRGTRSLVSLIQISKRQTMNGIRKQVMSKFASCTSRLISPHQLQNLLALWSWLIGELYLFHGAKEENSELSPSS